MGIKRGQHTIDGCFDKILFINFINIALANALKNIAKKPKLAIYRIILTLLGNCQGGNGQTGNDRTANKCQGSITHAAPLH